MGTIGPICTVPMSPEQEEVLSEKLKRIKDEIRAAEVDTTVQQFESLNLDGRDVQETAKMVQKVAPVMSDTDSTGTPWDERIHSASKALNSDGTWRLRRKPKDMAEAEWGEYVEEVKSVTKSDEQHREKNEQILEEEYPSVIYAPEPSVTPAGDDFHVDAGEVTEQQIASIPVPPLPVPPAPPVQQAHMTFPQVMQFLTERHGRITSAQVDDIIADMGLNSIMDLNTQPEYTGPFITRVKSLLGE